MQSSYFFTWGALFEWRNGNDMFCSATESCCGIVPRETKLDWTPAIVNNLGQNSNDVSSFCQNQKHYHNRGHHHCHHRDHYYHHHYRSPPCKEITRLPHRLIISTRPPTVSKMNSSVVMDEATEVIGRWLVSLFRGDWWVIGSDWRWLGVIGGDWGWFAKRRTCCAH